MDVMTYVTDRFGEKHAKRLVNIGRGGDNNKKGSDFENFFAASKICCLAAEANLTELDDYHVACQETAFVDDLCVRRLSKCSKTNYQAKNSDGAAANWDHDMETRFEMQYHMDVELHLTAVSVQILLVSCPDKAAANDAKIPKAMKAYCESEHFPHYTSSTQLVMGHAPLRNALNKLCGTESLSNVDAAFRLVLGEWCGDNENGRTVGDVLRRASANSRPDLFVSFNAQIQSAEDARPAMPLTPEGSPKWLSDLLAAFQMSPATVECGAFIVSYNGMQARVAPDVANPSPEALTQLKSPGDIIMFLMSLAAEGLDDQLPTGEIRQ